MVCTEFPGMTVFLCCLFVLFLFGFACGDVVEEEARQKVDVTSQKELQVENSNGKVTIQGWSKSHMELRSLKRAARKDLLDAMNVELDGDEGTIRVHVSMPEGKRTSGECSPRVDLDLNVPSALRIKASVLNGRVRVSNMNPGGGSAKDGPGFSPDSTVKDLDVETKNGALTITNIVGSVSARNTNGKISMNGIRGCADARSSNGSIDAEIREAAACGRLRFETSNGSLRIKVVPGEIARIVAKTINGGIEVQLPSASVSTKAGRSLELAIQEAGAMLEAFTSNGPIRIDEI